MTGSKDKVRMDEAPKAETNGEMRRERRRKDGDMENAGLRLTIPDWVYEKYPKSEFGLTWLRDEPARIAQKHKEDWDAVEGVDPIPGALDRNGNPCNHVLHVKRQEWVLADRAKAEERRKLIEDQARRGSVKGRGNDAGTLSDDVSYADASNRLR